MIYQDQRGGAYLGLVLRTPPSTGELVPLYLAAINGVAAVAAAFLARSRAIVEIDPATCTRERRLSSLIYLFIVTTFASLGVQLLQRRLYVASAVFLLLAGLCIWRMVA